MRYYKTNNSVIATTGELNLPEINKIDYDAELANVRMRQENQAKRCEKTRSRTVEESLIALNRCILTEKVNASEDKTLAIESMALFETWKKGIYEVGDIRTDPITGYPYECILAHDSIVNTEWTIDVRTLWKPYHSRKEEFALPFEAPTGAHDMYKVGEYCIFNNINIYKCIQDTSYSPSDYTQAWELVE